MRYLGRGHAAPLVSEVGTEILDIREVKRVFWAYLLLDYEVIQI